MSHTSYNLFEMSSDAQRLTCYFAYVKTKQILKNIKNRTEEIKEMQN